MKKSPWHVKLRRAVMVEYYTAKLVGWKSVHSIRSMMIITGFGLMALLSLIGLVTSVLFIIDLMNIQ